MKTVTYLLIGFIFLTACIRTNAQSQEAQQLVLNYTKLQQLEEILDNMYKGYKILAKGYNTIKDISEGNFNLHQTFLDGLFMISPAVRQYRKVPLIINYQKLLVNEYKRAFEKFRNDPNLTVREIKYLEGLYSYIFKQSLRNLDELVKIITASNLRMNDEERMRSIDRIYAEMEERIVFLKMFNASTQMLVIHREKERNEIRTQQKLHNVAP